MVGFSHSGTYSGGPDIAGSSISDLVVYDTGNGLRVYMLAADGGSLSVYDPASNMAMVQQVYFSAGSGSKPRLELTSIEGQDILTVHGASASGLLSYPLAGNGSLGTASILASPTNPFLTTEIVNSGGNDILFAASATVPGLTCWLQDGNGEMQQADSIGIGSTSSGQDILAMT